MENLFKLTNLQKLFWPERGITSGPDSVLHRVRSGATARHLKTGQ